VLAPASPIRFIASLKQTQLVNSLLLPEASQHHSE
jgi:hypothetical protein